jgi:hypothetical protein
MGEISPRKTKRWARCGSHRYDMRVLPPLDPLDHPFVWRASIPTVDTTVYADLGERVTSLPERRRRAQERRRLVRLHEHMVQQDEKWDGQDAVDVFAEWRRRRPDLFPCR